MSAYFRLVTALYYGPAPRALEDFIAESKEKNEAYAGPRREYSNEHGLASAGTEGVRTFKVTK